MNDMAHHKRRNGREVKERVLHTRVPEGLEIELKRLADSLRVRVSNVVRAVLENALEAVEAAEVAGLSTRREGDRDDFVERLAWMRRLRSYEDESFTSAPDDENGLQTSEEDKRAVERGERKSRTLERMMRSVVGFQPLTLAKASRCTFCRREITTEQPAFVTVRDRKGPRFIICAQCLPKNDGIKNQEELKT